MIAEHPPDGLDLDLPVPDGRPPRGRLGTVDDPRGMGVVSHGLGEHGGAHAHVAEILGRVAPIGAIAV